MSSETQTVDLVQPPADVPEIQRGDWLALDEPDPVAAYLAAHQWDQPQPPTAWEVARFSHAAYVYREVATHWTILAKFYVVKMGEKGARYAEREFECTRKAQAAGLDGSDVRAVRPLATWRGVLFLEYVDGLTLEDVIAVRRRRPGTLTPCLEQVAHLLATLHAHGARPDAEPDAPSSLAYAREVVGDLVRWGVLERDPLLQEGLLRAIDHWAQDSPLADFAPALTHGDATTTNFIFPWEGGVVGVDWERLYVDDPAADLGRLMAETSHSIKQHGGSVADALPFVRRLADAYCQAATCERPEVLLERARFYQASSTLRIARNGWVSKLDRMGLVAQALVLLDR